jgi:hypothetical protein
MRGRLLAAALGLAAALFPVAARAGCPPIQVVVDGSVTREGEGRPVANLPITVRMQSEEGGLPTMSWEAVVTDKEGRYRWTHAFDADPCREGNFLLTLPWRFWGKMRHPLSKAYSRRAMKLPRLIVLNTGSEIRNIPRERLLDALDPSERTARVQADFEL